MDGQINKSNISQNTSQTSTKLVQGSPKQVQQSANLPQTGPDPNLQPQSDNLNLIEEKPKWIKWVIIGLGVIIGLVILYYFFIR